MPPQRTNFTSGTGRDAAAPHLDLAIPLAPDAPGIALPEACPDASIAALRAASSEKEAAGPPGASTRSVFSVLRDYWRTFRERSQAEGLYHLSDRALADIGLTRGDIDRLAARGAIERLRDHTTWLSRGL